MWCYFCDKNNHNTANCRAIAKFKLQKKACFEVKSGPRKMSLAFFFEEINERHLMPGSDEVDQQEYLFTFS
jgi:hypothetical protein